MQAQFDAPNPRSVASLCVASAVGLMFWTGAIATVMLFY